MKSGLSGLRRLIREEITRSLLVEVACPVCGVEGAYVGLHNVECANPKCRHYKPSKPVDHGSTVWMEEVLHLSALVDEFPGAIEEWLEFLVHYGYDDVDPNMDLSDLFDQTYFTVGPDGTLSADYGDDMKCSWDGALWNKMEDDS